MQDRLLGDENIKNQAQEKQLLNDLNNNEKYTYQEQGGFYHVQSKDYKIPSDENMVRFYVDCNNGNIAELSQSILSFNQNPNFYLKFPTNESNVRNPRSEKLVIYCDKKEVEYTTKLLQYTSQVRPDLFKESNNKLPFFQKIGGVASIASQPKTSMYQNLYGQTREISQSVNSFITNILEESYMEASREIARSDANLNFLLTQESYYNERLYMNNLPYIKENYHDYLIESMKAKMKVLSIKNDIFIDGISNEFGMGQTQLVSEKNKQQNYQGGDYGFR